MNGEDTIVETQMMIRKPLAEVFTAFIDPEITKNFWFTKSTGRLEQNKTIIWTWEMYGVSAEVIVKEILDNEKITVEWGNPATIIDFEFSPFSENFTIITIKNYGFLETGKELIEIIKDRTGGFTTVLDGLKAYLEYGINLNLTGDKFPKKLVSE